MRSTLLRRGRGLDATVRRPDARAVACLADALAGAAAPGRPRCSPGSPARPRLGPAIPWAPCPTAGYECATRRRAARPHRRRARAALAGGPRAPGLVDPDAHDAVVALAGGPGQAALPLVDDFAKVLKPFLTTRDLLVFDQRGTGSSGALDCSALHRSGTSPAQDGARCASQLGAPRGFYRTRRQRRRHRGAARRRRLRQARPVRRLLRHEGRAGLRGRATPTTSRRSCSTPSCCPTAPTRSSDSYADQLPRVLRDLCAAQGVQRATHERHARPRPPRRQAAQAPRCAARSTLTSGRPRGARDGPDRPARRSCSPAT